MSNNTNITQIHADNKTPPPQHKKKHARKYLWPKGQHPECLWPRAVDCRKRKKKLMCCCFPSGSFQDSCFLYGIVPKDNARSVVCVCECAYTNHIHCCFPSGIDPGKIPFSNFISVSFPEMKVEKGTLLNLFFIFGGTWHPKKTKDFAKRVGKEWEGIPLEFNFAIAGNIGIGCYSCRGGGGEEERVWVCVCVCMCVCVWVRGLIRIEFLNWISRLQATSGLGVTPVGGRGERKKEKERGREKECVRVCEREGYGERICIYFCDCSYIGIAI